MDRLAKNLRRVIPLIFGNRSPEWFIWTDDTWSRAQSVVKLTPPDDRFYEAAEEILKNALPECIIGWDPNTAGHATAILARDRVLGVVYALLICHFYPVGTVHACTDPGPEEGLDSDWELKLDTATASKVKENVRRLALPWEQLLGKYGYQ